MEPDKKKQRTDDDDERKTDVQKTDERKTDENGNPLDDNGNPAGIVFYGDERTNAGGKGSSEKVERLRNLFNSPSDTSSSLGTPSTWTQDADDWLWRDQDKEWKDRDWLWKVQDWLKKSPSDTSLASSLDTPTFSQDGDGWQWRDQQPEDWLAAKNTKWEN